MPGESVEELLARWHRLLSDYDHPAELLSLYDTELRQATCFGEAFAARAHGGRYRRAVGATQIGSVPPGEDIEVPFSFEFTETLDGAEHDHGSIDAVRVVKRAGSWLLHDYRADGIWESARCCLHPGRRVFVNRRGLSIRPLTWKQVSDHVNVLLYLSNSSEIPLSARAKTGRQELDMVIPPHQGVMASLCVDTGEISLVVQAVSKWFREVRVQVPTAPPAGHPSGGWCQGPSPLKRILAGYQSGPLGDVAHLFAPM